MQVVAVTSSGERHVLVPYTKTAIDCKLPSSNGWHYECVQSIPGSVSACGALQDVLDGLDALEQYTHCDKDRDCLGVECVGNISLRLTILPCYSPPAIELEIKGENIYVDHIFSKAEDTLYPVIHDELHAITVTVEYMNDTIGFEVGVIISHVLLQL